jgi:PleD family two-component response regulator
MGSRFTVSLPARQKMITTRSSSTEPALEALRDRSERSAVHAVVPSDSKVVLLAEDNTANILTIGEYLKSHGYKFVAARDGLEAIEKAEAIKHHPHGYPDACVGWSRSNSPPA